MRIQKKTVEELNIEMLSLLREQFNLRMQVPGSQLKQTHLLKRVRRNIARVKMLLIKKLV